MSATKRGRSRSAKRAAKPAAKPACQGAELTGAACERTPEGPNAMIATLPNWRRLLVCPDCYERFLQIAGLRAPHDGSSPIPLEVWVLRKDLARLPASRRPGPEPGALGAWVQIGSRWAVDALGAIRQAARYPHIDWEVISVAAAFRAVQPEDRDDRRSLEHELPAGSYGNVPVQRHLRTEREAPSSPAPGLEERCPER